MQLQNCTLMHHKGQSNLSNYIYLDQSSTTSGNPTCQTTINWINQVQQAVTQPA
jgi:hypothetical protein